MNVFQMFSYLKLEKKICFTIKKQMVLFLAHSKILFVVKSYVHFKVTFFCQSKVLPLRVSCRTFSRMS